MNGKFKQKNEALFLVFTFILAFSLRLAYLFFLQKNYFFFNDPSSDVLYYREWAHQIATGDWIGEETFYGLPLYPYFLAILERLVLGNLFLMRLAHIFLGSLNCLLVYWVAKRIFPGKVAGLAGLLTAGNFILIYYDWLMMPVTLLVTLSLLIVYSLLHMELLTKKRQWGILGFLVGLTILGDGKFLIFAVLACAYILARSPEPWKHKALAILLPFWIGLSSVLFLVSWRNKLVGGDWVFISAQSGLSFYVGNNPQADGIYNNPNFIRPTHQGQDEDQRIVAEAASDRPLSPAQVSHFWRGKGLAFIREQPAAYLRLLATKFRLFLSDAERGDDIDLILQREWRGKADLNPYLLVCPLALAGIVLTCRWPRTFYLNGLIVSQWLVTLIFFLTTRHRATILPFLFIYEAYSLWWLVRNFREKRYVLTLPVVILVLVFPFALRSDKVDDPTVRFVYTSKAARIYAERGEHEKAKMHYFAALQARPFDTVTLYNLANTFLQTKDLENAEKFYLKALAVCHFNVDALFNLAYLYEQTNALDQALQRYQEVLTYQPESLDVHYRLADIYQKLGDCTKAEEHLSIILDKQPHLAPEIEKAFPKCR